MTEKAAGTPTTELCNEQMCPVAGGGYLYCNAKNGHEGYHSHTFHTLFVSDPLPSGAAPGTREETPRICKYGDSTCPCPDGDRCHYEGADGWLLPCPFCGGPAEMGENDDSANFIECTTCGASTNLQYSLKDDGRPQLVERWNARTGAVHLSEAQADLTYWKRNALALTTLLKASTPDTQWPGIEKAFGELLDKLKADSAEAQAEVETQWLELAEILRLEKGDYGEWWIPADPSPRGPYSSIFEAAIGLMLFNDELVKSGSAEVERLRKELGDAKEELTAVLADWNSLVKASGSRTNGGAVGHVVQLKLAKERSEASKKAMREALELVRDSAFGKTTVQQLRTIAVAALTATQK